MNAKSRFYSVIWMMGKVETVKCLPEFRLLEVERRDDVPGRAFRGRGRRCKEIDVGGYQQYEPKSVALLPQRIVVKVIVGAEEIQMSPTTISNQTLSLSHPRKCW